MIILYETERLIIRQWEEKDAADLFEYCSDGEVTKYLRFPTYTDIKDAHERIADMQKRYAKDKIKETDWAIVLKSGVGEVEDENSTEKAIGSIGIVSYEKGYKDANPIAEIGYIMNTKFQGKGYMTEALVGMFKWIKHSNIAKRIEAKHDTANEASGRVMQKAGMIFEGIKRKATSNNMNARADVAIYSILWEEIKV